MLEISNRSNFLVSFDKYSNYVPMLSAATTLVDIFLHYVARPCIGQARLETNHYFAHLETKFFVDKTNPYDTTLSKPWKKYLVYIIPIIGNIWAAWQDYNHGELAKDLEKDFLNNDNLDEELKNNKHAKEIKAHPELFQNNELRDDHIQLYRDAQFQGSAEGAYRLGCLSLLKDLGADQENPIPQEALMYLRYAAAKGHKRANSKLGEISQLND